jgi:hypothetical protein
MKKYVAQPDGTYAEYDDQSAEYLALKALPTDIRPVFLAASNTAVKAYFDAQTAKLAESLKIKEVSNRQFKEALIRQGKDDAAEATIAGLPSGTPEEIASKKIVTNLYYNSNTFQRENQTLLAFAPALGLNTPADIDAFFAYAATL